MRQIYYNGTFLTMDDRTEGAEAVYVEDKIIRAVGSFEQVRLFAGVGAELFDMEKGTVLPGFIDGHSHISATSYNRLLANLKPSPSGGCNSAEDVVEELKRFLREKEERGGPEPGLWLIGMGYDNSAFPDGAHPTRFDLDRVSTRIPVAAAHVSGHLCVVNTKGMELLGYTGERFEVPAGGSVEPDGLLKEGAFISFEKQKIMKAAGPKEQLLAIGGASDYYASFGITTAQDGRTAPGDYALLKKAGEEGLLKNDVVMYLTEEAAKKYLPRQDPRENRYENRLRPAGLKLFLDGSPQGKTAWLSRPYYRVPEGEEMTYRGQGVMSDAQLTDVAERAVKNRWQLNVHANGDEAVEQLLRCYGEAVGRAAADGLCTKDLRPVIIHCQTARKDQIERMARLRMLASFFDDHVYYWGDYHYESVLGPERAENISPLSWALRYGVPFTLHQDSPVVPPDILLTVQNAVNRRTMKGRILGEQHRIPVRQALKAVTINGAYQIFEEDKKGSITPGKLADFVVLDRNPLKTPPDELKNIKVLQTIKEGTAIYSAKKIAFCDK